MSDPAASLGDFIRRQREQSATSMRQFAAAAGISNPYLSQIERGLRAPSERVLQAIADTLKVSAATLNEYAAVDQEPAEPSRLLKAIADDPELSPRQRQALTEVYEAFVSAPKRPHRR